MGEQEDYSMLLHSCFCPLSKIKLALQVAWPCSLILSAEIFHFVKLISVWTSRVCPSPLGRADCSKVHWLKFILKEKKKKLVWGTKYCPKQQRHRNSFAKCIANTLINQYLFFFFKRQGSSCASSSLSRR